MKVRTVLYADEGTVLTNGTDFGTVIWLADGVSPDTYRAIAVEEYEAILAEEKEMPQVEVDKVGTES